MVDTLVRGLAGLRKVSDENAKREEERNRPKANWFKFDKGVKEITVRFLQELDADSPNYNAERGLALMLVEHQAPGNEGYRRRGICTQDSEGHCYACERHSQNFKEGWRQRQNFYIQVLADLGEGLKTYVVQRNFNSTFVQGLITEFVDEGNSITKTNYRITRVGEGTKTQWLLKAVKGEPFDDTNAEIFEDETIIRSITYANQAEYYGSVYSVGAPAAAADPASDEW